VRLDLGRDSDAHVNVLEDSERPLGTFARLVVIALGVSPCGAESASSSPPSLSPMNVPLRQIPISTVGLCGDGKTERKACPNGTDDQARPGPGDQRRLADERPLSADGGERKRHTPDPPPRRRTRSCTEEQWHPHPPERFQSAGVHGERHSDEGEPLTIPAGSPFVDEITDDVVCGRPNVQSACFLAPDGDCCHGNRLHECVELHPSCASSSRSAITKMQQKSLMPQRIFHIALSGLCDVDPHIRSNCFVQSSSPTFLSGMALTERLMAAAHDPAAALTRVRRSIVRP
jgi:hypothetical protein